MNPDLKKLLKIDEQHNQRLSLFISETNKRHPGDRLHFANHLSGKLEDPEHTACIPDLEQLCSTVMKVFTRDEVQFLIDNIMPNEEEMKMLAFMMSLDEILFPTRNNRNTH